MRSVQGIEQGELWMGRDIMALLEAEAICRTPCETGGVLLGYWAGDGRDCVVTHVVGPGPNATHCEMRFAPDHEHQVAEIERLYQQSSRRLQYLGDWHSHPGGGGELSKQDRRTLRTIARSRTARVSRPVMLILAGGPVWEPHAWRYGRRRKWLWTPCSAQRLRVNVCDPIAPTFTAAANPPA